MQQQLLEAGRDRKANRGDDSEASRLAANRGYDTYDRWHYGYAVGPDADENVGAQPTSDRDDSPQPNTSS